MRGRLILSMLLLTGLALVGPASLLAAGPDQRSEVILVKVDEEPITVDEFMRFLAQDASRVPLATTVEGKAPS